MRYAPGVPYRSTGWTYIDSTEEARDIAAHTPNPMVVEAVDDYTDEYGTPPRPLDQPSCSECQAVIGWRPDDPPGTPCAECCADHLQGPPPDQGGRHAG